MRKVRGWAASGSGLDGLPLGSGATVNGPATSPVVPMTRSTEADVNVVGSMSRSKTTSSDETVPLTTRLSTVLATPGTKLLATCGPGTISGSVFWSNEGPTGRGAAYESPAWPGVPLAFWSIRLPRLTG